MDYAGHTEVKDNRRNRVLASTPLLVVATIMVLVEVGSMAKGAAVRYPLYTTAKANLAALTSGLSPTSCAMADDVLAEPDPNAGMLQPVPGQTFGPDGPLGGSQPGRLHTRRRRRRPGTVRPGGDQPGHGQLRRARPTNPTSASADSAGTGGGYGPVGVNGSHVALPFGLDPARTPVMGSYGENTVAAKATSAWYQLPPRTAGPAAGDGRRRRRHLVLRRGRRLPLRPVAASCSGASPARTAPSRRSDSVQPIDIGPNPPGATCGSR